MSVPHQFLADFTRCPLCDELVAHPQVDLELFGDSLDDTIALRITDYQARLQGILMDHLHIHTAQIMLA